MDDQKAELTEIVGASNVYDTPEILDSYAKDESFVTPLKPALVVKVNDVQEVQKIVQWANQTNTPLVPVSSGSPHFRGDTVPSVPEAVIVDLSGMKKIIAINRRQRIAIIEPGVTYEELQKALAKEGLRISTSLAPRGNKSVIASLLEIEPRLNPRYQWSYIDPLRCLEVVWGDGNVVWTGEAGGSVMDLEKQWMLDKRQLAGVGPLQIDFFRLVTAAQGSVGIVTWASVKCDLLPQIQKLNFVPAKKPDDLMDFVYKILKNRFADELMIMNSTYLASLLGESADHVQELRSKFPLWFSMVNVAGREILPKERVALQEQDFAEFAQQFGLKLLPSLPGASGENVLKAIQNPSEGPNWKLRYKGGRQDIFFITTLDKTPAFISTVYSLSAASGFPTSDIGVYIQPQQQGVSCHCEFSLPYDPDNLLEVNKVKELFAKASEEFLRMGAFFSRPYGIWSKMMFNKDAQATMTLKKVKGIFDPNNIMNTGKLRNY